MEQVDAESLGLGMRELVVLRLALLHPLCRSLEEYADCCGLSLDDTSEAASGLADLGLIGGRDPTASLDLRPNFQHESWPLLAGYAAATPIRWPDRRHVPREPRLVRSEIDERMGSHLRAFRTKKPARFDAEVGGDIALAISLLWEGAWRYDTSLLAEAAVLFSPDAWRAAAGCFLEGSLRQRAGLSIAASRTLPGQPPTLVIDRQRVNCSVCGGCAASSEGRHTTEIHAQLGEGLLTATIPAGAWKDEGFVPGCGVVWTHYTMRAWLAEVMELNGPDGRTRRWIAPPEALPDVVWLDP